MALLIWPSLIWFRSLQNLKKFAKNLIWRVFWKYLACLSAFFQKCPNNKLNSLKMLINQSVLKLVFYSWFTSDLIRYFAHLDLLPTFWMLDCWIPDGCSSSSFSSWSFISSLASSCSHLFSFNFWQISRHSLALELIPYVPFKDCFSPQT